MQDTPKNIARYLKLWVEGKEEGLSCAIEAVADLKGLRSQCAKHLRTNGNAPCQHPVRKYLPPIQRR